METYTYWLSVPGVSSRLADSSLEAKGWRRAGGCGRRPDSVDGGGSSYTRHDAEEPSIPVRQQDS